jgi:hypothetical protein
LVLFLVAGVWARDTWAGATIVAVRGDVHVVRSGAKPVPAAAGGELRVEDTLKTGDRGRAQLSFPDKTLINLGNNTELQILEFRYDPDKAQGALVTSVSEGLFRVIGGAIAHIAPDRFQTKTPTATIGIRGSGYVGEVTASRTATGLSEGKGIYVANERGTAEVDQVGYVCRVRRGEAPGRPQLDMNFIQGILKATELGAGSGPGPGGGGGGEPGRGANGEPGKRASLDNAIIRSQTTFKGDVTADQSKVAVGTVSVQNSAVKNAVIDSTTTMRGQIDAGKSAVTVGGVTLRNTTLENTDIKSTTTLDGNVKATNSDVNIGGVIKDE